MNQAQREPIFNVPRIVVGLIGLFVAIHLARGVLSPGSDDLLVALLAFNPARYSGPPLPMPGEPWAGPLGFVSHALLHGDLPHLLVNSGWLLAMGAPVARRMSAGMFLVFFALCAMGGALLFLLMHAGLDTAMLGASGAISGLMGAAFRLLFAAESEHDRLLLRHDPAAAPCLSLRDTLTRRQPLTAIIVWIVVNFVAAIAFGPLSGGGGIAWEAHLGGFFTGLLAFDLFDRGQRTNGSDRN